MKYSQLDAPALLDEFKKPNAKDDWSQEVAGYFEEGVAFNQQHPGVHSQFYNPLTTSTDDPYSDPLIDWPAFPKLVKDAFPDDPRKAWETAEKDLNARLERMDEYLEWHVIRNSAKKITRVSFTCETTQYYDFLARYEPETLLAIYRDLVDPAHRDEVKLQDLIAQHHYLPRNRWNTEHGAVHLIQPNNNLYAEVMIAAQACLLHSRPDGTVITDSDELIRCAGYGEPGRASDPKIGATVNALARQGYSISLRNPVALYMTHWSSTGWKKPDNSPVGNYWTLKRGKPASSPGKPAMGLHLVYEVPASEGFVVGDIKIGGDTIDYGGQIADTISVGLFGLICRQGALTNPSFPCSAAGAPGPAVAGAPGPSTSTAKPALRARNTTR